MSQSQSEHETLFCDDRELAKRTGLSRSYWAQMRCRDQGPAYRKIGRRCLYRWDEVLAWIEAQRVGGGK